MIGRDKRMYGPLPEAWAKYRGMYYHGQKVIVSYTVGKSTVLEMPSLQLIPLESTKQVKAKKKAEEKTASSSAIYQRTFNIGPRDRDMILQVANYNSAGGRLQVIESKDGVPSYVIVGGPTQEVNVRPVTRSKTTTVKKMSSMALTILKLPKLIS